VEEDYRRRGTGEKLMDAFTGHLKENRIKGVYLSTFSEHGSNFFLKNGFTPIYENTTSLWRYILGRDVKTYVFGKILD
jgi:N-acetylglutamate synthase-like GNAT family acetyltransferase